MLKKGSVVNGVVAPLWTAGGTSNTLGTGVGGASSFRLTFFAPNFFFRGGIAGLRPHRLILFFRFQRSRRFA